MVNHSRESMDHEAIACNTQDTPADICWRGGRLGIPKRIHSTGCEHDMGFTIPFWVRSKNGICEVPYLWFANNPFWAPFWDLEIDRWRSGKVASW